MTKTDDVLMSARDTLRTAKLGLDDLASNDPRRRIPGFRNLVVFGRAVTNVLQKLRSSESGFDAWYMPYVDQMRGDPLLRYFYGLRSTILKEGEVEGEVHGTIDNASLQELMSGAPRPPNARRFFIGDMNGGSGWEVLMPDGSVEKFYAQLPTGLISIDLVLPKAPVEHLGASVAIAGEASMLTLATAYMTYLENLLLAAQQRFGGAV